jgi:hypothetical protein
MYVEPSFIELNGILPRGEHHPAGPAAAWRPSSRLPGIMRLRVSGLHDAIRRTKYSTQIGTRQRLLRVNRAAGSHRGASQKVMKLATTQAKEKTHANSGKAVEDEAAAVGAAAAVAAAEAAAAAAAGAVAAATTTTAAAVAAAAAAAAARTVKPRCEPRCGGRLAVVVGAAPPQGRADNGRHVT